MLMNWKNKSLRFKLVSGTLISLLPIFIIVFITYNYNKSASIESSSSFLTMMNKYESQDLNGYLEDQMAVYEEWVAEDIFGLAIEFNTLNEINGNFESMLGNAPGYSSLRLIDKTGKVVASAARSDKAITKGVFDNKNFDNIQSLIKEDLIHIELIENDFGSLNNDSKWSMQYSFPSRNSSGDVNGLFVANLDWSVIDQKVLGMAKAAYEKGFENAKTTIVNANTNITISHSSEENIGGSFAADNNLWNWLKEEVSFNEIEIEEVQSYSIFARVHDGSTLIAQTNEGLRASEMRLILYVPKSDILAKSQEVLIISLIIAFSGILLAMLTAYFLDKVIVTPIKGLTKRLSNNAQQVGSASDQVASASQSLAEGSSETASSLEETSSSLEEMASMTRQNADNTKQANSLVLTASDEANKGMTAMDSMSEAMNEIKNSSDETAKIIKVIDEIAFQTNLLALNAAVEAARAGEAGKGFAVVAEEVRNLAQRSAEAAKDTSSLIEGSQKSADAGVKSTQELVEILKNISGGIKKVTDLMDEVTAASDEQAQGIDQVNSAVGQMDQVTQQNAANAEQSSSASEELASQAEEMENIVDRMNVIIHGTQHIVESKQEASPQYNPVKRNVVAKKQSNKNKWNEDQRKASAPAKVKEKALAGDVIPLDDDEMSGF